MKRNEMTRSKLILLFDCNYSNSSTTSIPYFFPVHSLCAVLCVVTKNDDEDEGMRKHTLAHNEFNESIQKSS